MTALRSIMAQEGFVGLWRGLPSMILGAGYASTATQLTDECRPSHALYFTTYEECKKMLKFDAHASNALVTAAMAGSAATTVSDAFMNPFDVVK